MENNKFKIGDKVSSKFGDIGFVVGWQYIKSDKTFTYNIEPCDDDSTRIIRCIEGDLSRIP